MFWYFIFHYLNFDEIHISSYIFCQCSLISYQIRLEAEWLPINSVFEFVTMLEERSLLRIELLLKRHSFLSSSHKKVHLHVRVTEASEIRWSVDKTIIGSQIRFLGLHTCRVNPFGGSNRKGHTELSSDYKVATQLDSAFSTLGYQFLCVHHS